MMYESHLGQLGETVYRDGKPVSYFPYGGDEFFDYYLQKWLPRVPKTKKEDETMIAIDKQTVPTIIESLTKRIEELEDALDLTQQNCVDKDQINRELKKKIESLEEQAKNWKAGSDLRQWTLDEMQFLMSPYRVQEDRKKAISLIIRMTRCTHQEARDFIEGYIFTMGDTKEHTFEELLTFVFKGNGD